MNELLTLNVQHANVVVAIILRLALVLAEAHRLVRCAPLGLLQQRQTVEAQSEEVISAKNNEQKNTVSTHRFFSARDHSSFETAVPL